MKNVVASLVTRIAGAVFLATALPIGAQSLSIHWEDLTANDFLSALKQSNNTCLVSVGIVEKHGPTGPLGTDLMNGRYLAERAASKEYVIIFPSYYIGQISEARQQPGTISYSTKLQMEMMQATVEEMSRNGCKKIIIQSSHGGNTNFLHYFIQTQLDTPHDYVTYGYFAQNTANDPAFPAAAKASKPGVDGHAGEGEISNVMAHTPQDVHTDRAGQESGADLKRLNLPSSIYTGMFWYASYPNHYQGDAAGATAARGKAATEYAALKLAEAIKAVKADTEAMTLQKEYYEKTTHPVDTKQ
jgi:creatinine amidohydrolase